MTIIRTDGGGGSTSPNVNRLNNILRGNAATWNAADMMSNYSSLVNTLLGNLYGGIETTGVGDPNTGYQTPGGTPAQSGGHSGGTTGGTLGGVGHNHDAQGHETGTPGHSGTGGSTPMSMPPEYGEEGYGGGTGTPSTGSPDYYPESGNFPQTPMGGPGDMYNIFLPQIPQGFPEPDHDYTPPTFEGMELPETKFELPTAEVKPFGFADIGSRASGYSQPLELTQPLAAEVMAQVGRKHPLEKALTEG